MKNVDSARRWWGVGKHCMVGLALLHGWATLAQAGAPVLESLSLQPAVLTVAPGQSATLTGHYAGIAVRNLAWTLREGAAGGALKTTPASGGIMAANYVAPVTPGVYHVRFYDKAKLKLSAQSTITVSAAPAAISVHINPAAMVMTTGASQHFSASVSGSAVAAVVWSASAGSMGSDGSFVAPAIPGSVLVRATSVADPAKSDSVAISVVAPVPPPTPSGSHVFVERFAWQGNHASTINKSNSSGGVDHVGSTVWWNEDAWDIVGDSGFLSIAYSDFGPLIGKETGFHVDVHKAASDNPSNSEEDNTVLKIGGDGSPGEAAMRLDEQGILGARLRNVLLIGTDQPAVVDFYAPRFVTSGHWWEVAITPAAQVIGAMNTSVPAQIGRRPFEDGLNVVVIGHDDVPCLVGWHVRYDVSKTVNGIETLLEEQRARIEDFTPTDPAEKDVLYHWRVAFRPSGVDLYADFAGSGSMVLQRHVDVTIPWSEVHVHLLGVAYQADHHPQDPACYQGKVRELNWRDVTVSPLKYARTSVAPRNGVTLNVQRRDGWLGYDLRDIQRFGPDVDGAPQANLHAYDTYGAMAFGSVNLTWAGAPEPVSARELNVEIDASQAGAALARLVYDIKGTGSARLSVNGVAVGPMPSMSSVRFYAAQAQAGDNLLGEYTHRALTIPAGLLKSGANTIRVEFSGDVALDRVHLEFSHNQ